MLVDRLCQDFDDLIKYGWVTTSVHGYIVALSNLERDSQITPVDLAKCLRHIAIKYGEEVQRREQAHDLMQTLGHGRPSTAALSGEEESGRSRGE